MNLHRDIMNMAPDNKRVPERAGWAALYLDGHKDARHHAAELALAADELSERLLAALELTRGQWIHSVNAQVCLDAIAAARSTT